MSSRVRIGVAGVGALGAIHARVLADLPAAELVGVHDADPERGREVAAARGVSAHESLDELLQEVEALVVATHTPAHHAVAKRALEAGVHVLVEKPLASSLEEARDLVATAERHERVLMVGHVERFNPAVTAILERRLKPRFIEAQRVSSFAFRSKEVGVVMDLMIHDIDLVLHLIASPLASVHAVGACVIGEVEDMANARLVFEDGAVANVTASRLALKVERKLRLFAQDVYATIDFRKKAGRILTPAPGVKERMARGEITLGRLTPLAAMTRKLVKRENLRVREGREPLGAENAEFCAAIREERPPMVPGAHGLRAMEAAARVTASIAENLERAGG